MPNNNRSLVKNAASEKQVKRAAHDEKHLRDMDLEDLRTVLRTVEGRKVLWRVLSKCKTFNSVWHPSAAIHYNSGQQDIGHWLMSEIVDAGQDQLFKMMQENYEKGEMSV